MSMGTWAAIFIAIFCGVISSNIRTFVLNFILFISCKTTITQLIVNKTPYYSSVMEQYLYFTYYDTLWKNFKTFKKFT
ncbi:hypothetical protein [Bacillus cereus]|uniref:hypothetical protein n=1 Tax=Bacillus cereus TaxID=1396 RepID=UPI0035CA9DE8